MNVPSYLKKGYYTLFSKENCTWCDSAKELLEQNNKKFTYVDCTYVVQTNKEGFLQSMKDASGVDMKTFPIIFYEEKYIGGFEQLRKHIK